MSIQSRVDGTIENITDQLEGFSQEVASVIKKIQKQYDLTWNEAKEVVQLGIEDMRTEVFHNSLHNLHRISDSLYQVSESLASNISGRPNLADGLSELVDVMKQDSTETGMNDLAEAVRLVADALAGNKWLKG